MRLLLTFDKFKDSMTAREACDAAHAGAAESRPDWEITEAPLTDGGDGFTEIFASSLGGDVFTKSVTGPDGKTRAATFGLLPVSKIPKAAQARLGLSGNNDGQIAIVEMAQASGLSLLNETDRNPLEMLSTGTGELIAEAARLQPDCILLGVGGSATHDLGIGALSALGLRFAGRSEAPPPKQWSHGVSIERFDPPPLPPIKIACDVTNPLLGKRGAAAVFAPQKGLPPDAIPELDAATEKLARSLLRHFKKNDDLLTRPGSGAAGGIAFGLMVALDAELIAGFDLTMEWLELEEKLRRADWIWTGEGSFDDSSMGGKGPGRIVAKAREMARPCTVLAGRIHLSEENRKFFPENALHSLSTEGKPTETMLQEGPQRLHALAAQIASRATDE